MAEHSPDVVVAGGGAIGCAAAWELARRGARVTLVERGTPGQEATWAAAGMLSPLGEAAGDPAFLRLGAASLDRYTDFAAALLACTGIEVEYRTTGKLYVALDTEDLPRLEEFFARGAEFGAERLSAEEARDREPALSPSILGAVFVRRDHRVNNRRLGAALWSAAVGAGVDFRLGVNVREVRHRAESGRSSVQGVALGNGSVLQASAVVIAAGAGSARIGGLPSPLPVRPVRGQMFAVKSNTVPGPYAAKSNLIEHVVMSHACYMLPRDSGTIVVGATVEEVGLTPGPTPRGIATMIDAAVAAVPAVADLPLVETWSGFRPGTPDNLPILGCDPDIEGLFYATGHFRNGILLAPITAEIIADLVSARPPAVPIERFDPARFRVVGS